MKPIRWFFVLALTTLAGLASGGCGNRPANIVSSGETQSANEPAAADDLIARIDASLARVAEFIVSKQSDDGAWRSETYGMFKDGTALTPYVLSALFFIGDENSAARRSFRKGTDNLLTWFDENGALRETIAFPVLTAVSASRMVVLECKDKERLQAQKSLLEFVLSRQLNSRNGWSADDPEFGGWGFSLDAPVKPAAGQLRERFFESNMVATIFGIAALQSARIPKDDPVWSEALVFVKRCQNFSDDPAAESAFDDGGFFFIPDEPLQNKAGTAGQDAAGRLRFHSYGTMTADGLRALLQCGLPPDHPRALAALNWLTTHFDPAHNPGRFNAVCGALRDSTYYYWAWSCAHAFSRIGVRDFQRDGKTVDWARDLAVELLRRQNPDGSWTNSYTDGREDDPLVAAPWAASALAICRATLAGSESNAKGCKPAGAHPRATAQTETENPR